MRAIAVLLGILGVLALAGPGGGWAPDTRASQDPTGGGQQETMIAANPTNPDNAIAVYKDYRTLPARDVLAATTDGGATWREQPFPEVAPTAPGNTDPAVVFRPDGRAYILGTAIVDWPDAGLICAWSDDGGATWSPPVAVTGLYGHYDDKAWLAADPATGTLLAAWTRFAPGELAGIDAARSTDGGATWSPPVPVSGGAWAEDDDGAQIAWLRDGTLWILFSHTDPGGATATLVAARSRDGGQTFGPDTPLFTIAPPPHTLPGEVWPLFTYPSLAYDPARDTLSVVWGDAAAAATAGVDILLRQSTDGGATWTAPRRLNDDPPDQVRDQWFPALSRAPDGRLTALWLDRRDDPANRRYAAYARTSLDGGATWAPAVRVSRAASDPNAAIPPGADGIGDYIGLSSANGVVWAAWVDGRNGNQDIYAARERFTPAAPTPVATATAPPRPASPTPSPTPCAITFADVPPGAWFAPPVQALACAGVVSGYAGGTFRPYAPATRAQAVKIVLLGFGVPIGPRPSAPPFADVPPTHPFAAVIATAAQAGLVAGYPCGGPGEPCDPLRRPYFRPGAPVTRGQLAQISVRAAGWPLQTPPTPTFADVPPGAPFYAAAETAAAHGILSGYTCGAPAEPCDPQHRPYLRPNAPTTRAQIAKIIAQATGR